MSTFTLAFTVMALPGAAGFQTVYNGPHIMNGHMFNHYVNSFYDHLSQLYSIKTAKSYQNSPQAYTDVTMNQHPIRETSTGNGQITSTSGMMYRRTDGRTLDTGTHFQSGTPFQTATEGVSQVHSPNRMVRQLDSATQFVSKVHPSSKVDPVSQVPLLSQVHPLSQPTSRFHLSNGLPSSHIDHLSQTASQVHRLRNTVSQVYPSSLMVSQVNPSSQMVNKIEPSSQIINQVHPAGQVVSQVRPANLIISQFHPKIQMTNQASPASKTISQTFQSRGLKHPSNRVETTGQQFNNLESPKGQSRQYPNQLYQVSGPSHQIYPDSQTVHQMDPWRKVRSQNPTGIGFPYQTSNSEGYVKQPDRLLNNQHYNALPRWYPTNPLGLVQRQATNLVSNQFPKSYYHSKSARMEVPKHSSNRQLPVENRRSSPLQQTFGTSGPQEARSIYGRHMHKSFQSSFYRETGQMRQQATAAVCDPMEYECVPLNMCTKAEDIRGSFRCANPEHVCCDS